MGGREEDLCEVIDCKVADVVFPFFLLVGMLAPAAELRSAKGEWELWVCLGSSGNSNFLCTCFTLQLGECLRERVYE